MTRPDLAVFTGRRGLSYPRDIPKALFGWHGRLPGTVSEESDSMTATTSQRKAHARVFTVADAQREIDRLLDKAGMSHDDLVARGDAWELDAEQRGVLADIRGLEFLLNRARAAK